MATKINTSGEAQRDGGRAGKQGKPKRGSRRKIGASAAGHPDAAYLALIERFPLRPIRGDGDLDVAATIIDDLTDRSDLSSSEADYLEVLGDLVEKYEDEHVPMPNVSDAEMLRYLMEARGASQANLVRGTGISKTVLSLVLSGKRHLTREHIEALSTYFEVSPATFLSSR